MHARAVFKTISMSITIFRTFLLILESHVFFVFFVFFYLFAETYVTNSKTKNKKTNK